jgi:hypothetical protein
MASLLKHAACAACGHRHHFCLPLGDLAQGQEYEYVCPETGTLAHVHLLGHGRITDEAEDHEPLTDLLTVFLGMGVFTANSVIREKYWHAGQWSGWSMGRRGYLSMPMYGYAFALFARARGEDGSAWARELRLDVRSAFEQALRFVSEVGNAARAPGSPG